MSFRNIFLRNISKVEAVITYASLGFQGQRWVKSWLEVFWHSQLQFDGFSTSSSDRKFEFSLISRNLGLHRLLELPH